MPATPMYVVRVGTLQRVLADQLEAEEYTTKTRGTRYQPGARAIAEGCYAFVRHADHVHLVYRVDRVEPDAPEEVRVPEAMSHIVLFERESPGSGGRSVLDDAGLILGQHELATAVRMGSCSLSRGDAQATAWSGSK